VANVVGVVFHKGGRVYYFDPASIELVRGDQVVVQTMGGTEIGEVVDAPHDIGEGGLPAPLKRVVRKATEKDLEVLASNEALRLDAMKTCRRLIAEHGLDMKLVDAEIVFGGGKINYTFYSDERVDFRALVADLAKMLKVRIELRQIGAREEARAVGGLGPCGRHLCCTLWQGDQEPVSIRMAKEQHLPLNPMKISGLCGRLMCCLKYEQEQYVCFRKEAPSRGTQVQTDVGDGVVVGYQVPKDALTLRFEDGSYGDVPIDGCSCGGAPCRKSAASEAAAVAVAAAVAAAVAVLPSVAGPPVGAQAEATAAACPSIPPPREPELVFEENGDAAGLDADHTAADLDADEISGVEPGTAGIMEESAESAASSEGPPAEGSPPDGDMPGGEGRPGGARRGRSRGRRRRPRSGGGSGSQPA
jgi:cell fate regulator YaaT (PSP1 superfamily)